MEVCQRRAIFQTLHIWGCPELISHTAKNRKQKFDYVTRWQYKMTSVQLKIKLTQINDGGKNKSHTILHTEVILYHDGFSCKAKSVLLIPLSLNCTWEMDWSNFYLIFTSFGGMKVISSWKQIKHATFVANFMSDSACCNIFLTRKLCP